jgi:CIC family chloride channel protein
MGVVFERDLMDLVVVKELATTKVITAHADEDLDQTQAGGDHLPT